MAESYDHMQGQEQDVKDHPDNGGKNFFTIPSRDFSKEPATVGEMISTTAKMVAEPYARTISKAYDRITK